MPSLYTGRSLSQKILFPAKKSPENAPFCSFEVGWFEIQSNVNKFLSHGE